MSQPRMKSRIFKIWGSSITIVLGCWVPMFTAIMLCLHHMLIPLFLKSSWVSASLQFILQSLSIFSYLLFYPNDVLNSPKDKSLGQNRLGTRGSNMKLQFVPNFRITLSYCCTAIINIKQIYVYFIQCVIHIYSSFHRTRL